MRKNVKEYVRAESWRVARNAFGELLLLTVGDYIEGKADEMYWRKFRFIPEINMEDIEMAFSLELSRYVRLLCVFPSVFVVAFVVVVVFVVVLV